MLTMYDAHDDDNQYAMRDEDDDDTENAVEQSISLATWQQTMRHRKLQLTLKDVHALLFPSCDTSDSNAFSGSCKSSGTSTSTIKMVWLHPQSEKLLQERHPYDGVPETRFFESCSSVVRLS